MIRIALKIYDYMRTHRMVGLLSFIVVTVALILLILRVQYKEDISDFLPIGGKHAKALNVFQDVVSADKIFVLFQSEDTTQVHPDRITQAIEFFVNEVANRDTVQMANKMTVQVDLDMISNAINFIYENIPYFLTNNDYTRIDSLLAQEDFVREQLQLDKQMLVLPTGNLLSENIGRDPLCLFTPIINILQSNSADLRYEIYDGYVFSPDMRKAVVMIDSPFGASETENNARLVSMLRKCADVTIDTCHGIDIHLVGAPVIAVGNANQIKSDSILSVTCAMLLILALSFYVFRRVRNLLLIVTSICWGWLFGLGCLSIVNTNISIIVLGISSVVIGIAVNYPLHLIAHLSHASDKRNAIKEIVTPLLVGNITTVGAFLALVPLKSVALRDLGLFSSFLLIGTIIFVLLYLPHVATANKSVNQTIFSKIGDIRLENNRWVVWSIVIITVVLGYFSLQTRFDSNMTNINYMSKEQKQDMVYLQREMMGNSLGEKVYVVSSGNTIDEALDCSMNIQPYLSKLKSEGLVNDVSSCNSFLSSKKEQALRLKAWEDFVVHYRDMLIELLNTEGLAEGFQEGCFDDFYAILKRDYIVRPLDYFRPLTEYILSGYISKDDKNNECNVVDVLTVDYEKSSQVEKLLSTIDIFSFDAQSMNRSIADNLSDNFNYIGWACGCIVFFFLWLSLGSIELAILSFLPMAVSWIWILGLMAIFGLQFNIVNIILATFIFGQGDDYTIFMTEGSCYEYAYRRKILGSYKNSIIISALIMFIGIGALILAKHPALRSLAEVTVVGMLSVVLMAYILPPLIYKWLVSSKGTYRVRPLSFRPMMVMGFCTTVFFIHLLTAYIYGFFLFIVHKRTDNRVIAFKRYVQHLYTYDFNHIPSVGLEILNVTKEDFSQPSMIISNHQSMLDAAIFMMLSPKCVLVSNENPSNNTIIKRIYHWMGFVTLSGDIEYDINILRTWTEKGYSIVMFPEGERNPKSSILRFHKGAFYIAERLNIDIIPIVIHGLNNVLPRNSISVFKGKITIFIGQRIEKDDTTFGNGYVERTKAIRHYFVQEYSKLRRQIETSHYYKDFVKDRYRYKGYEIYGTVVNNLKVFDCYSYWIYDGEYKQNVVVIDSGYGEFALMYSLVHPETNVLTIIEDDDKATILKYCASDIVKNLSIKSGVISINDFANNEVLYLVEPNQETEQKYDGLKTIKIKR